MALSMRERLKQFKEGKTGQKAATESIDDARTFIPEYLKGRIVATASEQGILPVTNPSGRRLQVTPLLESQIEAGRQRVAEGILRDESELRDRRRPRGRAATLLTGGTGLIGSPATSRRTLMGF